MSALALSVSLALSLRVLRHRLFGVFERPCLPRMHVVDEEAFYSCMHVVDEEALLLVPSESSPNAVCISLMPSAAVRVSSRLCVRVVYVYACIICIYMYIFAVGRAISSYTLYTRAYSLALTVAATSETSSNASSLY